MKKIFLIILGLFLLSCLIPVQVDAGLVPCGMSGDDPGTPIYENCPCTFCHFFIMLDRIIDFTLVNIVFPVAILILVIGGVMFLIAAGEPDKLKTAKNIMTSVILGLVIIFSAWIFISMFFDFIGVAEWTGLKEGWWQIECPVPSSITDTNNNCILDVNE